MNTKEKKIQVTDALRKGLYAFIHYGNYELNFEIADRVLADHPNLDRQEVIESLEDAQEFIRQIAISKNTGNPLLEEVK
ncbi:MAG: hypothetical protein EBZ87_04185 [Microbacteriaceae bacterium]|nr:hypothetical protein [Microbacteriaceae bacterium]